MPFVSSVGLFALLLFSPFMGAQRIRLIGCIELLARSCASFLSPPSHGWITTVTAVTPPVTPRVTPPVAS